MAGNANSGRKRTDPWTRFWRFVRCHPETGCWHWTGGPSLTFWGGDEPIPARRWIFDQVFGPVPRGRRVKRTCPNPRCVSPHHAKVAGLTPTK